MKIRGGNAAIAQSLTVPVAGSGDPPTAAKPRLLLVDDEQHVLEGLALHLRKKYDVVSRTSGAAGLESLAGEPFAVVVSDLRMPRMSGIEFLSIVRDRAPDTTRVLLTGFADVTSAIAAVNEAGVHRLLTKPCPPEQLARALEEAIAATSARTTQHVDAQLVKLGRQATLGIMAGSIGDELGHLVTALSSSLTAVQDQIARGELPTSEDMGLMGIVRNRLEEHTRALRDLSRPREGRIESLDVGTLLCRTVDMVKIAGMLKLARTRINLPIAAMQIEGDVGQLEGVLINLLRNAMEALTERIETESSDGSSGDSAKAAAVTVSVEAVGDQAVSISVTDNGSGVAKSDLPQLFETYFTTKAGIGGIGLGLAIARETVEQHGGFINVDSREGHGSTFTIELPLLGCPSLRRRRSGTAAKKAPGLRLVTS